MRTAIIDLGSSSFHLLIAEVDELGIRREIYSQEVPAQVAGTLEGGLAALDELVARSRQFTGSPCRIIARGGFRACENELQFLTQGSDRSGVEIDRQFRAECLCPRTVRLRIAG